MNQGLAKFVPALHELFSTGGIQSTRCREMAGLVRGTVAQNKSELKEEITI
jgi:hypothetical protein